MGMPQTEVRREVRARNEAERFEEAQELRVAVETGDYPDRDLVEFDRAFHRFAHDASVRPLRKF